MAELALRQNVNDLEEVLRRDAQRADERVLNRARHLVQTSFVVLSFEDMNFRERHVLSPLLIVTVSRIECVLRSTGGELELGRCQCGVASRAGTHWAATEARGSTMCR